MSGETARYTSLEGAPRETIQTPEKVGPMGALTPNIGPGRPIKEVDVDTSLPYPSPVAQAAPALVQMSRVDGCPECVVNTEAPFDAWPTDGGYVATYQCTDCGHRWSTAWRD